MRKKAHQPWYQHPLHQRVATALTDEQWIEVKRLSGLPEEARSFLEECISSYCLQSEEDRRTPTAAKTREKVKNAKQVATELFHFLSDPGHDVLSALLESAGNDGPVRIITAYKFLENKKREIGGMVNWLEKAELCIQAQKPGRDKNNADWLINRLDTILYNYTGRRLNRSGNKNSTLNFALAVVKLVDPKIGRGTVEASIKRLTSNRKSEKKSRRKKALSPFAAKLASIIEAN